jgi:GH18 family chitinase
MPSFQWVQTTALKKKNPALRVFLSIGGWSFNDPVRVDNPREV